MKTERSSSYRWGWIVLLFFLVFTGCGGKTPVETLKFTVEYTSPPAHFKEMTEVSVKLERFSASSEYMTTAMLIKPSEYVRSYYHRGRWNIPPADMITSMFLRDLRFSGLFKRVYSPDDIFAAHFTIDGRIEEFLQIDTPERSYASFAIHMTVSARDSQHPGGNVVIQKIYRAIEPLSKRTPRALAEGMSQAAMRVSHAFMEDLWERLHP